MRRLTNPKVQHKVTLQAVCKFSDYTVIILTGWSLNVWMMMMIAASLMWAGAAEKPD